jgi:hypothetical protein
MGKHRTGSRFYNKQKVHMRIVGECGPLGSSKNQTIEPNRGWCNRSWLGLDLTGQAKKECQC